MGKPLSFFSSDLLFLSSVNFVPFFLFFFLFLFSSPDFGLDFAGKVHGSLARAGKVRGQTPKVAKQDKKKKPRGRAHKRMQYNRRFVTAGKFSQSRVFLKAQIFVYFWETWFWVLIGFSVCLSVFLQWLVSARRGDPTRPRSKLELRVRRAFFRLLMEAWFFGFLAICHWIFIFSLLFTGLVVSGDFESWIIVINVKVML